MSTDSRRLVLNCGWMETRWDCTVLCEVGGGGGGGEALTEYSLLVCV